MAAITAKGIQPMSASKPRTANHNRLGERFQRWLFNILTGANGPGTIMVCQFFLAIAAELDTHNGLLLAIAAKTGIQVYQWKISFWLCAAVLAVRRRKKAIDHFDIVLCLPFFGLLIFTFELLNQPSGGAPPSLFLTVLLGCFMLMTVLSLLRTLFVKGMAEQIIGLRLQNGELQRRILELESGRNKDYRDGSDSNR